MENMIIHLIAAARPNFMKIAPLYHALKRESACRTALVHTGQHYDAMMSDAFFRDLQLPDPDIHLGVGSGSHAEQTGQVMIAYEKVCLDQRPDWVIVAGDVNSTLACALAAKKLCLSVAHLEAGLRSGDRTMPEEINRIVTDAISDLLWTPSPDADENLCREGVPPDKIERVGNIMIDSLEMLRGQIETCQAVIRHGLQRRSFGVVTLHRPSNVDDAQQAVAWIEAMEHIAGRVPLVFPVHPRTQNRLEQFGLWTRLGSITNVHVTPPLGYVEFMSLVFDAQFVITDSGGLQEETTYLHVPCLTLRDTTERPVTVTQGTNRLVRLDQVVSAVKEVLSGQWPKGTRPEGWDGRTANRVVNSLCRRLKFL